MAKKIKLLNKIEAPKKQDTYRPDPLVKRLLSAPPGRVLEWHVLTNPVKRVEPELPQLNGPFSTSTNNGKKKGRSGKSRKRRKKLKALRRDLWGR